MNKSHLKFNLLFIMIGAHQERNIKIMSLNIWGGLMKKPLLELMRKNKDIDIFCLQEVYSCAKKSICTTGELVELDIFEDISKILPNHILFFVQVLEGYGIGMLIKKDLNILDKGEFLIHENSNYTSSSNPIGPTHSRKLQWVNIKFNNRLYTVINLHGLWNGNGKTDTEARIIQSKNIKKFIDEISGQTILCGDFNLRPDTESIKILDDVMKNLIKIYKVQSTRTRFYKKMEKHADYFFISHNIKINHFKVLKDEVSDYAPLLLCCHL
jgi:endonuclease/exonuclease/phosphatase family metal-dependent hydrolase